MSVLAELLIPLLPVSFIVESGGQEEICSKGSFRSISGKTDFWDGEILLSGKERRWTPLYKKL